MAISIGSLRQASYSPADDAAAAFGGEAAELIGFARSLGLRSETSKDLFDALIVEMTANFKRARNGAEQERAAEDAARALRLLWLEVSAASAGRFYRSPLASQTTVTATGRAVEFGYERDLQPAYLEERCRRFFDVPPKGWSRDHILFSSGQSAMAAVLHALEGGGLFETTRKLSFAHLGSYFETAEIFSLFSSLLQSAGSGRQAVEVMTDGDADIFIVEPVFCDGEFGRVDVPRLIEHHRGLSERRRVYLFDNTLLGASHSIEGELARMLALRPAAVFRIVSALKLLQGGLELSNVGILSVFAPEGGTFSAQQLGNRIRRIRTLLGLGLSFAEVAALEAPWFLDRDYTAAYQKAIFENNAALAQAVSAENRLFRGVFHPSMLPDCKGSKAGPYCVFRLAQPSLEAYAALEEHLGLETRQRGILFGLGGSFGFRGHRFEVVRPEDGTEPFLRVALGRRRGWSFDHILRLMADVARAASVAQLQSARTTP